MGSMSNVMSCVASSRLCAAVRMTATSRDATSPSAGLFFTSHANPGALKEL